MGSTGVGGGGVLNPADRPVARDRVSAEEWAVHVDGLSLEDLRRLAVGLPVIEQAKGVLMGYYACDAAAAFALLSRWSTARNIKLRLIAADVVAAASRPSPDRYGSLARLVASLNAGDNESLLP